MAIGFVVFLFLIQNRNKREAIAKVKTLLENGEIVNGFVTGKNYNSTKNVRSLRSIMYKYIVDSVEYKSDLSSYIAKAKSENSEKKWFEESEISKGDSFVVLYDTENPSISILCIDYPLGQKQTLDSYRQLIKVKK